MVEEDEAAEIRKAKTREKLEDKKAKAERTTDIKSSLVQQIIKDTKGKKAPAKAKAKPKTTTAKKPSQPRKP